LIVYNLTSNFAATVYLADITITGDRLKI
jgi:hypothetical protein